MKKALALVILIVAPSIIFAQGTIAVANGADSLVMERVPFLFVSVPAGGGMVQFLAAADGTPVKPLGTFRPDSDGGASFITTYNTLASYLAANPGWNACSAVGIAPITGRFNAGVVTVSPLVAGGNIEYVVIGWTGSSASLDDAIASGSAAIGESALYTGIAMGNPTTTPPATPSLMSSSFLGLALAPVVVPEPSAFELAGLGAVMLAVLRRRG